MIGQLVGLLLLVGLIGAYWQWFLLAAVLVWGVPWAREQGHALVLAHRAAVAAERRRCAELCARADQQHAWAMAGDPRGTYGQWPPST